MFEATKPDSNDKPELYRQTGLQAEALITGEPDMIANLANISALLWLNMSQINWAGFYLKKGDELVLGPFQGKPACVRIPVGRGVCGTAAATGDIQLIEDVHQFPGHIACDAESNSEIVLPIHKDGEVIGVLDIDSPIHARFDEQDAHGLSQIVAKIEASL